MLKAGRVWALGAMSGTSLDGVDAAMIETDGHEIFGFGPSAYRPYSAQEAAVLHAARGHWPGTPEVARAAAVVEAAHIEVLRAMTGAALVGFHGQTLAHEPGGRGTHQAGDGARLAQALGLPVVWDFRSTDVRLGGEGAPLAPFYHFACARWIGATRPLAFLNLGGVGNLTWLDPRKTRPEEAGALLAFDTGPAKCRRSTTCCARDGARRLTATARWRGGAGWRKGCWIASWTRRISRGCRPNRLTETQFAGMIAQVGELSDADAAATLTAMAASAVRRGMAHCPVPPERVLVCGGGRRNPAMMAMLAAALDCPVMPVEDAGLDGDMLEAQAFAYLAVRVARGLPTSCPGTTGVRAAVSGGVLSHPMKKEGT